MKAMDPSVTFRTRQPDLSHSSSEHDISKCRVLNAIEDPVALRVPMAMSLCMVVELSDYRCLLCMAMVRESGRLLSHLLVRSRTVAELGLLHQQCNFLSLYTSRLRLVRERRSRVRLVIRLAGLNDEDRYIVYLDRR
ncbi:hypothetical protein Taro_001563 [Colocasia esculenta]|uniref:Uncharacterized protein n=1 Tax=Colocasia esculenta TaxID=4460 RepID=A0A843TJE4_COLES|nr:hypothetical protein [Colocasia esculenta]